MERVFVFLEDNSDGFWLFRTGGTPERKFRSWEAELPENLIPEGVQVKWCDFFWLTVDKHDTILEGVFVGGRFIGIFIDVANLNGCIVEDPDLLEMARQGWLLVDAIGYDLKKEGDKERALQEAREKGSTYLELE